VSAGTGSSAAYPPTAGGSALADLVAAYVARRPGWQPWAPLPGAGRVTLVEQQVLVPGRPGVVDVVAETVGRHVHVLIGLRPPGDAARFLAGAADPVLGLFEDADGLSVAFDALADEQTATAVLEAVAGLPSNTRWARLLSRVGDRLSVAFDDRVALTVVDAPSPSADTWLDVRAALDTAGCNHLPAPVAFWRRHGRALGLVHELLPTAATGWSLALGSLRDLLAAGVEPDAAGGDFADEATALGATVARLHGALDRAFGHWPGDVVAWSAAIRAVVGRHAPELAARADVRRALDDLATLAVPCCSVRSYGRLSLERLCRTDQGWYVADEGAPAAIDGLWPDLSGISGNGPSSSGPSSSGPAGAAAAPTGPGAGSAAVPVVGELRPPLADVADLLWSLGHVAAVAVAEHGVAVGDDTAARQARRLVAAWERRNRRALVAGYLAEPGIRSLVPADRRALRAVTAAFELERAVRQRPLRH